MSKCLCAIINIIKENKKQFLLVLLFSIINNIVMLSYTVILQIFIDTILVNLNINKTTNIIIVFISIVIVISLSSIFCNVFLSIFKESTIKNKKIKFIHHILNSKYVNIKKWNSGQLLDRYNRNNIYAEALADFINDFIIEVVSFILIIGYLYFLNPLLSIITIIGTMLTSLIKYFISKRSLKYAKNKVMIEQSVAQKADEYIGSITQIKNLNINDFMEQKIKNSLNQLLSITKKHTIYVSILDQISYLVLEILRISMYLIAGIQVATKAITPGKFVAFYSYIGWLDYSFGQIWTTAVKYSEYSASIKSIEEVTSLNCDVYSKINDINFRKLIVENLFFSYPIESGFTIENLNLELNIGYPTVIMGRSGCGKSTSLNIIAGFYKHDKGNIFLGNTLINQWSPEQRGDYIGYVGQSVTLFMGTIRENLCLDKILDDYTILNVLKIVLMYEFITSLPNGLDTIINEGSFSLSQGQTQRMGIARTLLRNTPVLLFDEPTANLDESTKILIFKGINQYCKDKILLYVMHDFCDEMKNSNIKIIDWDAI